MGECPHRIVGVDEDVRVARADSVSVHRGAVPEVPVQRVLDVHDSVEIGER